MNGVAGLLRLGVVLLIVIWIYGSVWNWASSPPAPDEIPPEQSKSPQPAKSETPKRRRNVLHLLFMTGSQILLLFLVAFFFVNVVPRFASEFESSGVQLPPSIRLVLNLSFLLKGTGFLLIPVLLLVEIGVSILLWYYNRRRLLRLWSIALVVILIGTLTLAGLALVRHSGSSSSDRFFGRLPDPGRHQEQHSYVQQKLSSDLGAKLHEAGVDVASWLVTLSEDLSRAKVSMEGITRKRMGEHGQSNNIYNKIGAPLY